MVANILGLFGPQGVILLALIIILFFGKKLLPMWAKVPRSIWKSFREGVEKEPLGTQTNAPASMPKDPRVNEERRKGKRVSNVWQAAQGKPRDANTSGENQRRG